MICSEFYIQNSINNKTPICRKCTVRKVVEKIGSGFAKTDRSALLKISNNSIVIRNVLH